ncbi:unnamed protein product, partial [Larinioides sclopetarius]
EPADRSDDGRWGRPRWLPATMDGGGGPGGCPRRWTVGAAQVAARDDGRWGRPRWLPATMVPSTHISVQFEEPEPPMSPFIWLAALFRTHFLFFPGSVMGAYKFRKDSGTTTHLIRWDENKVMSVEDKWWCGVWPTFVYVFEKVSWCQSTSMEFLTWEVLSICNGKS